VKKCQKCGAIDLKMGKFRKMSIIDLTAMKYAENEREKFSDGLPNVTLTLPDEYCLPSTFRANFGFDCNPVLRSPILSDFYQNSSKLNHFLTSETIQSNYVFTLTNYALTINLQESQDPGAFSTKNSQITVQNTMHRAST